MHKNRDMKAVFDTHCCSNLLARLPQPLQSPESQPLPSLQASFPAMERQVMAIQAGGSPGSPGLVPTTTQKWT